MGDGRYYSWLQFYNILILTFSLMFVVIGLTFFYHKSRRPASKNIVIYPGILMCLCLIFAFLDEVVYQLSISRFFKTAFISIVFILVYLRLWYLTGIYCNYLFKTIIRVFTGIILAAIILNPLHKLFFIVYDFNRIEHSVYLKSSIGINLALLLTLSILDIYYKSNYYDIKSSILLNISIFLQAASFFLFFFSPIFIYFKIYIYTLPLTISIISLTVLKYSPRYYLPNSYRDAVENLNELILICNRNGNIVYSNKSFFITPLDFSKTFSIESLDSIFTGLSSNTHEETVDFLEYRLYDNKKEYIVYVYKHKLSENNGEGCVYRIVDRTSFYEDLKDLREKNEYLNSVNKELLDYSQEVERLDSEKERNRLLFDVQNILGHRISELIKMLESLENVDTKSPYYLDTIVSTIKNARECLATIRKTVNEFKESYEVKKID